jgi:hypothetical protein
MKHSLLGSQNWTLIDSTAVSPSLETRAGNSQHANREATLKEIRRKSKVNISRGLHIVILNVNTKLSKNAYVYTQKQDRQSTYKVTLRRVRESIVTVQNPVSITHFPESVHVRVWVHWRSRVLSRV